MLRTSNFRCRCTCARAHLFLHLGNYWADWAEILYTVRYTTASYDAHLKLQVPLHVRTCTFLFCSSETTGTIGLKYLTVPLILHRAYIMHCSPLCVYLVQPVRSDKC